MSNLAIGVDYIYRNYDNGTANYTIGFQPGSSGYPLSQIYTGPLTHTDATTGKSAPYYVICQGCSRPSGVGEVVMTNPRYQTYSGVDLTFTKRFSNRWQAQSSLTIQTNPNYIPPEGLFNGNGGNNNNPTGVEFQDRYSTIERYVFKAQGSYTFPWDIIASGNLNLYEGATRTLTISGPGQVYGGVNATTGAATTINYGTLEFTGRDSERFKPIKILDLGVQKVFQFSGGRQRVKLMFDAFNVFNVNTITNFVSGNLSVAGYTQPSAIVSPRVFRFGTQIVF
jgi:hypothetical protein